MLSIKSLYFVERRENSETMRAENLEHGHENLLPEMDGMDVENGAGWRWLDGRKVMGQGRAIVRA